PGNKGRFERPRMPVHSSVIAFEVVELPGEGRLGAADESDVALRIGRSRRGGRAAMHLPAIGAERLVVGVVTALETAEADLGQGQLCLELGPHGTRAKGEQRAPARLAAQDAAGGFEQRRGITLQSGRDKIAGAALRMAGNDGAQRLERRRRAIVQVRDGSCRAGPRSLWRCASVIVVSVHRGLSMSAPRASISGGEGPGISSETNRRLSGLLNG